ncbi:hypothetical protein TNCV_3217051 [Trichonephila clavipes]|nr:hypothetical protein TNCV_3217051 [Trichonephila clavipes]
MLFEAWCVNPADYEGMRLECVVISPPATPYILSTEDRSEKRTETRSSEMGTQPPEGCLELNVGLPNNP